MPHKNINIEILSSDNKRIVRRLRIRPPKGQRFTPDGRDRLIEAFVDQFDAANPNHKYRAVFCKDKLKLVHEETTESEHINVQADVYGAKL